jgi:hypothetical protein
VNANANRPPADLGGMSTRSEKATAATELANAYAAMVECWVVGGEARPLAPPEWVRLAADREPAAVERGLLALAAQFAAVALRPSLPAGAALRTPLPLLAAPALPERLRPLLRSALAACPSPQAVIRLTARRGFAVNPADWFPPTDADGVPGLYLPWIAWAQDQRQTADAAQSDQAEAPAGARDWRLMAPAELEAALRELRRTNPAESRAVLRDQFKLLSAPRRAALMKVLEVNLAAEDEELLAELSQDRSAAVRSQAELCLARLGKADNSTTANGLAAFFRITSAGLARKRPVVTALPLKIIQSAELRAEMFQKVTLPQLAGALGFGPDELVRAWDPTPDKGEPTPANEAANRDFVALVARTGSDAQAEALALKLIRQKPTSVLAVGLLERLDPAAAAKTALANLRAATDVVVTLASANDQDVIVHGEVAKLVPGKDYLDGLAGVWESRDLDKTRRLAALGTMMTASAAEHALEDLTARGAHRAMPALATLVLNAALAGQAQRGGPAPLPPADPSNQGANP